MTYSGFFFADFFLQFLLLFVCDANVDAKSLDKNFILFKKNNTLYHYLMFFKNLASTSSVNFMASFNLSTDVKTQNFNKIKVK